MQIAEPNAAFTFLVPDTDVSTVRADLWSAAATRWAVRIGAFVALVVGSLGALAFIDRRGVIPTGDEPTYLDEAFALGRLHTWNLARALTTPFASSVNGSMSQLATVVLRRGESFPSHSIGFSALLAPFVAASDSLFSARFGLIVVLSALAVWLGEEVVGLWGRRTNWAPVAALVFITPTYLIASTQTYPDLVSGLLLALVVVRLARAERRDTATRWTPLTSGLLLGVFAVVDDKNIVIAVFLGVITALVLRHRGSSRRDAALELGPGIVAIALLLAFNFYAYGRGLGPAQPIQPISVTALTKFLALLVGKRDGMFVQCPLTIVGVVALTRLWRSAPRSTIAAGAAALGLLVGNASVTGAMSGGSFFGRYQWEVFPLLLAFAGLYIADLWSRRPRAALGLVGFFVALTSVEWATLASNRPTASSFMLSGNDPASFAGWWGRLDPSPALNYFYREWQNARVFWGLVFAVALTAAIITVLRRVMSDASSRMPIIPAALTVAAVSAGALALTSPFPLPEPVTYIASDLSPSLSLIPDQAVTLTGVAEAGKYLSGPGPAVLPGRYRVSIAYSLSGSTASAASTNVIIATPADARVLARVHLRPGLNRDLSVTAVVMTAGTLSVRVLWHGPGTLRVSTVTFAKIATCSVMNCAGGLL